jgi:hypothetical protein
MGAAREKDQADFDLERFIDMFDEAMTSKDPRVVRALRDLMMMVTLTRPESHGGGLADRQRGPLRRLYEDIYHLNNRLGRIEEEHSDLVRQLSRDRENYRYNYPYEKYSMQAAKEMANQIDQDLINQLKVKAKGLYEK